MQLYCTTKYSQLYPEKLTKLSTKNNQQQQENQFKIQKPNQEILRTKETEEMKNSQP